jgi:carboxymethylenebutenolidase
MAIIALTAGCGGSDGEYSDDMAEQHADDTPEATAAAREPIIPVNGSTVSYATTDAGEAITGYIAAPARPDSVLEARGLDPAAANLPGLIVIHEWWGLNDNIRAATRRLAGEGYRALAVDLYRGATAETPDGAQDLMQTAMASPEDMLANLEAAAEFLRAERNAPRIGIMGWCFGGGMALNGAIDQPSALDAVVIYYGRVRDVERAELDALEMPVLGHFGEADTSIPMDNVRTFEQMLNDLGKDSEIYTYAGAGHAFANPSGQNYDPEAAATAWDRTTRFLREALYRTSSSASASTE